MIIKTPECRCLNCGKLLNRASGIGHNNDGPRAGDLSICLGCGAVMIYAEDLGVRGMTEKEMDRLCNDTETMRLIAGTVREIRLMPKMN